MTLPLLATLFMMLLTIAGAGVLSIAVSVAAREKAWQTRNELAAATPLKIHISEDAKELTKIFRAGPPPSLPPQRMLRAGKHEGSAEHKLDLGMPRMLEQLPPASSEHAFFHGTWDQRELRFEPKDRHARLTLESRLKAFSPPELRLQAFKKLLP